MAVFGRRNDMRKPDDIPTHHRSAINTRDPRSLACAEAADRLNIDAMISGRIQSAKAVQKTALNQPSRKWHGAKFHISLGTVAVSDFYPIARLLQVFRHIFGDHHRAVLPPGTAESDGQI